MDFVFVVQFGDDRSVLPSLNTLTKKRLTIQRQIKPLGVVHQLLELKVGDGVSCLYAFLREKILTNLFCTENSHLRSP